MQKVDLKKVLEMLINEEQGNAENLLRQWFLEKTKAIHESLMQEEDDVLDDDATKKIKDDQDSIEAEEQTNEEYYAENDLGEEDDEETHLQADAADDIENNDDLATSDFDNESSEEGSGESSDLGAISDKVEDLQTDLERLKKEFAKIQDSDSEEGKEDEENTDAEEDEAGDHKEPDGDEPNEDEPDLEVADGDEGEESSNDEDSEEDVDESFSGLSEAKKGLPPWLKKYQKGKKDKKDDESTSKKKKDKDLDESFDFLDLEEDYNLEDVSIPTGERLIGTGGSYKPDNVSPIPQRKTTDRVGGSGVKIDSGKNPPANYARETPPKVSNPAIKDPKNQKQDLKAAPDGKGSLLRDTNKGFGPEGKKSPIGSGATDLRGNDLKRK